MGCRSWHLPVSHMVPSAEIKLKGPQAQGLSLLEVLREGFRTGEAGSLEDQGAPGRLRVQDHSSSDQMVMDQERTGSGGCGEKPPAKGRRSPPSPGYASHHLGSIPNSTSDYMDDLPKATRLTTLGLGFLLCRKDNNV